MKKILALILSALMLLTVVACGSAEDTTADTQTDASSDKATDTEAPVVDETPKSDVALETIAKALADKYAEYTGVRDSYNDYIASVESEEDKMSYEDFVSFQIVTMAVEDFEYLMGLTEVPAGIGEAYLYQPGMMGQAYIGYIFRLADGTDIEAFKTALKEKADLRWNICTSANTIICENYGDTVFFSMMVVADEENPFGFTAEQKDGFIKTFQDTVSAK